MDVVERRCPMHLDVHMGIQTAGRAPSRGKGDSEDDISSVTSEYHTDDE